MNDFKVMTNGCEINVGDSRIIKYKENEVIIIDKGVDNIELQMLKSFQKIIDKLDSVNDNLKEMQKIFNRKNWE